MISELILAILIGSARIEEPKKVRATCYIETGNPTASGVMPEEGMIAGRKEDIGKMAILYDEDMHYIGLFAITDTGGEPIRQGKVIDVYRDSMDRVLEWHEEYGKYCYMQIINTKEVQDEK